MARELTYIMVDLQPQTAYWRGIIDGVGRYCKEHPDLRLRMPSSEWQLIGDHEAIGGVIAVVGLPDTYDHPRRFGKPVVNVSSMAATVPFPTVAIDNVAVGRAAADHLVSQGYHQFACHMESRVYFSRERLAGFCQRLAEVGKPCLVFDTAPPPGQPNVPSDVCRADTLAWLRAAPKPLGLFTHSDTRASMLIDICHEGGLTVPEHVGVLGMDNDELTAAACDPPLSSVDPAADLIGYRAAALLIDLIRGRPAPPGPILIRPRKVVPRQSTQPVFMDDELLARAVTYIRQHATDPITVDDVLDAVPLSRRSLERRFKDRLGRSPREEIRRVQLEKAKVLLAETDQSLAKVASATGYTRFRNFATAFRREYGTGPTAYRRSVRMR